MTRANVQIPVEQSRDLHYHLHEYLLTCVTWYADGSAHSQLAAQLEVTTAADLRHRASMRSLQINFPVREV